MIALIECGKRMPQFTNIWILLQITHDHMQRRIRGGGRGGPGGQTRPHLHSIT